MTEIKPIVRAVMTSQVAPVQWDAWAEDGTQYYLRYRHGWGCIRLMPPPEGELFGTVLGEFETEGEFEDMPLEKFVRLVGGTLAEGYTERGFWDNIRDQFAEEGLLEDADRMGLLPPEGWEPEL